MNQPRSPSSRLEARTKEAIAMESNYRLPANQGLDCCLVQREIKIIMMIIIIK
jgi:hypothetical protein